MAYLRPNWFTRKVFNRAAMRWGPSGTQTLVVPGRTSGLPRRVPVIPVEVGGRRYLVSPRGECEWVRNLRAASGAAELHSSRGAERVRGIEVPEAERGPVLEAYRTQTRRATSGLFAKLPDPADHPVFALEPR